MEKSILFGGRVSELSMLPQTDSRLLCNAIAIINHLPRNILITLVIWNRLSKLLFFRVKVIESIPGWCQSFLSSSRSLMHSNIIFNQTQQDRSSSIFNQFGRRMPPSQFVSYCIPGDGRCLFRSVVHGACLNAGRQTPGESLQRQLADELRAKVADEFIKRRADSEWFLERDFDMYVGQMRQPHRWGGEPELLMSSHVLQMPISVYMWQNKCGGLRIIAEYGQEYDKGKTIRVLYHSCGHYDALD